VTPQHVKALVGQGLKVIVQPSARRAFPDDEYCEAGALIQEDLSDCAAILGVKEVPPEQLLPDRTWCIFSHTIKAQPAGLPLLDAALEKKVRLVDYECITESGRRGDRRLVGFGSFAGYAGAISFLRGLGERLLALGFSTPLLHLGSAFMYPSLEEARRAVAAAGDAIRKTGLPRELCPFTVVIAGNGKAARGALDIFQLLPHEMLEPAELAGLCSRTVRTDRIYIAVATAEDMVCRRDGARFDKAAYYARPEDHMPIFHRTVLPYTTVLVSAMYWEERFPRLVTHEDLQRHAVSGQNKLVGICDITCDIDGPVPTRQMTSIEQPFHIFNPLTENVSRNLDDPGLLFHAVDHLPSELPREASQHFGDKVLEFLPSLAAARAPQAPGQGDSATLPPAIRGAIITEGGELTPPFRYIQELRADQKKRAVKAQSESFPLERGPAPRRPLPLSELTARRVHATSARAWGCRLQHFSSMKEGASGAPSSGSRSILVLGAGFVCRPLVEYLLRRPENRLVVASLRQSDLNVAVGGLGPRVRPELVDVASASGNVAATLEALVKESDLVVSLLPAMLHVGIAELAIRHQKAMVTTSYVSAEMEALDSPARDAGVLILNEVGLDPGIDHMSAMKMINAARDDGGRIVGFSSVCGGLPAPEAAGNPLGYKFSWSPRGVLVASAAAARFKRAGRLHEVNGHDLLASAERVSFSSLTFDALPNRDSTVFAELYGLADAPSFFRGTLRYPGFCDRVLALARLGLLEQSSTTSLRLAADVAGPTSCREWFSRLLGVASSERASLEAALESRLAGLGQEGARLGLEFVAWLGLLGDGPLPPDAKVDSPIDVTVSLLQRSETAYQPGERDFVAMRHELTLERADGAFELRSATLLAYGIPFGATAMSRTVGTTAAICSQLVLDEPRRFGAGVQRPLTPKWYEPALLALESEGISLEESSQLLQEPSAAGVGQPLPASVGLAAARPV